MDKLITLSFLGGFKGDGTKPWLEIGAILNSLGKCVKSKVLKIEKIILKTILDWRFLQK